MKLVVFGLTVSSSWGNGHATLWRGLARALGEAGVRFVFFERDVPYYAQHRDPHDPRWGVLHLYRGFEEVRALAERELAAADVAMVTSFCPDAVVAAELVVGSRVPISVFYDLDTPVTFAKLDAGERPFYLPPEGLGGFDLVLSYTGGPALDALRERLGARRVEPLYGWVDPELYRPTAGEDRFRGDLSYLGTYSADRQAGVDELFLAPARLAPARRFVIGGTQYPADFGWRPNVWFVQHVAPAEHPAFYGASRLTLNVTRRAMAAMGWCPSGRLFEAAACGTPVVSDVWPGLERFFQPGDELLVARGREDVLAALDAGDEELRRVAARARERTLAEHTAAHRARELLAILGARSRLHEHRAARGVAGARS